MDWSEGNGGVLRKGAGPHGKAIGWRWGCSNRRWWVQIGPRWSNPITLKMKGWGWLALLLGVLLGTAWARRSQDLHCGACRALVDELEWEIAQVDPKKTIQMGSFRINPDGSQSVVECESIVEEYEDELIEFFSREADNVKDKLCSKRTDLCDHALHISHDEL
ncbi:protein canopy homolog 2 isoform X2 [Leopardus geoffroyi]|uniref:protein canopy homolog 2 isoform X2 n=1 Tax=Leopardus geoffroyi TaxID=46844 RepID=UPI001E25F07F|nr:protein canopy homolog 2 isoform X2 [Leopardus geoffroyi]